MTHHHSHTMDATYRAQRETIDRLRADITAMKAINPTLATTFPPCPACQGPRSFGRRLCHVCATNCPQTERTMHFLGVKMVFTGEVSEVAEVYMTILDFLLPQSSTADDPRTPR